MANLVVDVFPASRNSSESTCDLFDSFISLLSNLVLLLKFVQVLADILLRS